MPVLSGDHVDRALRVAIVGAGPAGIYTADALSAQPAVPVDVTVLERLPAPFGLVRYGVAPDHISVRSIRDTLQKVLERPNVHLLGGVDVGKDIDIDDLRLSSDAVVLCGGSAHPRPLGIDGEELIGSFTSTDLVNWYTGHPDAESVPLTDVLARAETAVVVGAGNVALDIVRFLASSRQVLEPTDMPEHVLASRAVDKLSDIHLLARRGPEFARFTTKELREIGELPDVDVIVDAASLAEAMSTDRVVSRNLDVLRSWAARPDGDAPRRVHLHFGVRPVRIAASDGFLDGVVVERTVQGHPDPAEDTTTIKADLVVSCIGYLAAELAGLPFDPDTATIPNADGRVLVEGEPLPRMYVAGWIKRGPTGVIGTNKRDARQTAEAVLADASALLAGDPPTSDLDHLLGERGITPFTIDDWRRIDRAERELGQRYNRERTTLHERAALARAAGHEN